MTFPKNHSRREFLKQLALAGAGAVVAPRMLDALSEPASPQVPTSVSGKNVISATRSRLPGAEPVWFLKTKPLQEVRAGIIGLGQRGLGYMPGNKNKPVEQCGYWGLLGEILKIPFVRVAALCDIDSARTEKALQTCRWLRPDVPAPEIYAGTEDAWEQLCEQGSIDVVFIATPWQWHVPMSVRVMKSGKHAFVEVPAAVTVEECWALVDTSEQTQRHCVMLENCCYGAEEMFVLNMVQQGVFGKLTHAECAYIHDLRSMLYLEGTEGDWRRQYHKIFNGNLYPTHGLGPVCRYFDVNYGDALDYLVSMSAPEFGLSAFRDGEIAGGNAALEKFRREEYVCGDINTTLIKTAQGRTILLQHDVVSPRPYSRLNLLTGTGATYAGYPPRLAIDDPAKYEIEADGAHAWLGERNFSKMRNLFKPPLWTELRERLQGSGHGGMDYVMCFRLLDCIRQGITPDITVYDAATWSCILELSAYSVGGGSAPIRIPDFTRGGWRMLKPQKLASVSTKIFSSRENFLI